ncbi:MAG: ATP-binding protein, partial [Dictyoglomaceae bacterium]|nr:ATP-binding protein [Dictyoglomaceae bacterium]
IDSAFLRPGRFDKIFYIGLPNMEARKEIIKLQLRERDHSLTEEDINKIAEKLEGYSGADIEQIIEESAFLAFQRRDKITESDILTIIENTPKSVSYDEIEQIEKWARERGLIK